MKKITINEMRKVEGGGLFTVTCPICGYKKWDIWGWFMGGNYYKMTMQAAHPTGNTSQSVHK